MTIDNSPAGQAYLDTLVNPPQEVDPKAQRFIIDLMNFVCMQDREAGVMLTACDTIGQVVAALREFNPEWCSQRMPDSSQGILERLEAFEPDTKIYT